MRCLGKERTAIQGCGGQVGGLGTGAKKREGTRLVVHPLSLVFRVMYFPAGKTLLVS